MGEDNVQIVRKVFDAFARRDVDELLEVMDADVEFTAPGTQELVGREVSYYGHEGVREYFDDVARVWEDLEVFLREYHEVGDERVLVVGQVRARGRQGQLIDQPAQWAWKIENEKIVWGQVFADRREAVRAIGLVEQA